MDDGNCHVLFLPVNEKSKVQLARRGNTVYKFKIIQTEFLKQLLQCTDVKEVQMRIENVLDFILSTYSPDFPKESVIATDKFAVHIKMKPWFLSNLLDFYNSNGKYLAGKSQFLLTIEKNSGMNSQLHSNKLSNASHVYQTSENRSKLPGMSYNVSCEAQFKENTESAHYNQPVELQKCVYSSQEDASATPVKHSTDTGSHLSLSKNSALKLFDETPKLKHRSHNIVKKEIKLPDQTRKEAEKTIAWLFVLIFIFSLVTFVFLGIFLFDWPVKFYMGLVWNYFYEES